MSDLPSQELCKTFAIKKLILLGTLGFWCTNIAQLITDAAVAYKPAYHKIMLPSLLTHWVTKSQRVHISILTWMNSRHVLLTYFLKYGRL